MEEAIEVRMIEDQNPAKAKESIRNGREITVGALKFCSFAEQDKATSLLNAIKQALKDEPNLDLLVTPEFSLFYPSDDVQETKKPDIVNHNKIIIDFGIPGVEALNARTTKADSRKPFSFSPTNNGEFEVSDGDLELIKILQQIRQLAKQFKTNILLGTVSEKQIVDGQEIRHNTLVIIDNEGKIVHLRR